MIEKNKGINQTNKKVRKIGNGLKEEAEELKQAVRKKTMGYIAAALGLVAGLAWNDAVKALIEYFFPIASNTIAAKFIYAALITLVVIIVTTYIIRENEE